MEEIERKRKERVKDCIRGSLIAGAAGDALGYPVEFMSRNAILLKYGESGITQFELDNNGKALVSDDTQMTLFTANGMLMGITRGCMRGIGGDPKDYVDGAYLDWYYTQTGKKESMLGDIDFHYTWLRDLPELAYRRAPGTTCLNACEALVTHLHPLGYLPAALMTLLISRIVPLTPSEVKETIIEIVNDGLDIMMQLYDNEYISDKEYLKKLTLRAIELSQSNILDSDAIRQIGEGWVAEEAWAISLYCVVRHIDNMRDAIIAAVNHDGDSDSTGSITGNIMGAIYGYEAIKREHLFCPEGTTFEDTLELNNIILALADDLFSGCIISEFDPIETPEKKQWYARYCKMKPVGLN